MNILLDLDGTLTDPGEGILNCVRHALDRMGYDIPPESSLKQYIGPPLHDTFRELLTTDDTELVEQAIAFYRERFAPVGLYENNLYPGIPETLEHLRSRGARLYLATSKPRVFAEKIIDYFQLRSFFQTLHGSELDGTRVRKPDLIGYILTEEKLRPEECIMVGDRKHDALGAIANNVVPHGVLWGYGSQNELEEAGCRALHAQPEDLREITTRHTVGNQ